MSNSPYEMTERQRQDIDARIAQDTEIREILRDLHERMIEELNEPISVKLAREKELEKLIEKPPPSRFNDKHFAKACCILRALRRPEQNIPRPTFDHDVERVLTYELTISVIKYSSVLREALDNAAFFIKFPVTDESEKEEVIAVAYDLLERNFRMDMDRPKFLGRLGVIQDTIMSLRTKIMAHLARLRIQNEASGMEGLLPEELRHQNQNHVDQNPLYAWINLAKSSVSAMVDSLNSLGLQRSLVQDDILIQPKFFYLDEPHGNLVRFHSSRFEFLRDSELIRGSFLIMQDKSDCLQIYTLIKSLFYKELLIRGRHRTIGITDQRSMNVQVPTVSRAPDDLTEHWYDGILDETSNNKATVADTIIVTHCGSGFSAAHLAVQLRSAVPQWLSKTTDMNAREDLATSIASKFLRRPTLNVVAFGVPAHKVDETMLFMRKKVGISNIRLYKDSFVDVSPDDSRIRGTIAILVNPPSSGSALKDPVKYLCSEGGDEDVLTQMGKYISHQASNSTTDSKYYRAGQTKFLQHALSFPKVKIIMYTTCSVLPSENKDVVETALELANCEMDNQRSITLAEALFRRHIHSFKDVIYDLVDMNQILDDYPQYVFAGPYLDMYPSSASSGGFIALIRRKEKQMNIQRSTVSSPTVSASGSPLPGNQSPMASKSVINNLVTQRFTQQELAVYLRLKTLGLNIPPRLPSNTQIIISISPQPPTPSEIPKKKIGAKKALVQRISIPTYSSLAKRTEKFAKPRIPGAAVFVQPIRQTMPNGLCISSINAAGPPCICDRHAKKFPEVRPQNPDTKK